MTSSPSWITVAPSRPAEGSSNGASPGFPGRAPVSRASHLGNIQTALLGRITPATTHQRGESTDARHRHEQTADRIRSDPLPHRLVEDGNLLPQLSPGGEERTHNQGNLGSAFKQGLDLPIKSKPATGARQQAEGLQNAAYHVGEPG